MDNILVVLDSNEIIIALMGSKSSSKLLIDNLNLLSNFYFKISSQIFDEITRNVSDLAKEKLIELLETGIITLDNFDLDFDLIEKYRMIGLKKGDILIGAYCEQVMADILVSENRHFLKELKSPKFKIMNAEEFLKIKGKTNI